MDKVLLLSVHWFQFVDEQETYYNAGLQFLELLHSCTRIHKSSSLEDFQISVLSFG